MLSTLTHLADHELVEQVMLLARREREATAILITHLAELDARRLYLAEGCSSLFSYCTQVLHLSEHAAYGRIEAARAARKFPVLLEMLSQGAVNLTTVCLLSPYLTPVNHRDLLGRVGYKSKRQVEELVAEMRPQPPLVASVRRLPTPSPAAMPAGALPAATTKAQDVGGASGTEPQPRAAPAPRAAVVALAPQRYKVQFEANAETYRKLQLAQDLLRPQIPDGNLGEIFDRALSLLLRDIARKKLAATERPRETRDATLGSRHIPAHVKRAVWLRDSGRCAFISRKGCRCAARAFLEFHHVVPYGDGGEATVENIQLRCRAHNAYEAELYFGLRVSAAREEPASYLFPFERCGSRPLTKMTCRTRSGPSP